MMALHLWFHLSDMGARNARLPRLGLVTLDEDFFVLADSVQGCRVVFVSDHATHLRQGKFKLHTQSVGRLLTGAYKLVLAARTPDVSN